MTPIIPMMLTNRNVTTDFANFHISYLGRYQSGYGCDTTALVLNHHVFFILTGYHYRDMVAIGTENGIQGCVDYFIEHIDQAHEYSEHFMVIGDVDDVFELIPTATEVIGSENIDRIRIAQHNL